MSIIYYTARTMHVPHAIEPPESLETVQISYLQDLHQIKDSLKHLYLRLKRVFRHDLCVEFS